MASGSGSDVIRVLSWNINGLKTKLKEKKKEERKTELLKIFDQYDIVLLQETKIGNMKDDKDDDKNWEIITDALSEKYTLVKLEDQTRRETADNQKKRTRDGEEEVTKTLSSLKLEDKKKKEEKEKTMYMTYFRSNSKGVAIIVKKPHTLLSSFSAGGYYAWVHVQIDQQKYTFVSVYYHKDADDQIRNLMTEILTEGSDVFKCRLVIGGDFNTTLDPELDATEKKKGHSPRRDIVNELLREVKLTDVWRKKHLGKPQYTRTHTYTNKLKEVKTTGSRLDYVFMLEDDVKYVESCEIHNDIALSDHSPVSLTLNYTNDRRV